MTKSYMQILKDIERLQNEAVKQRQKEAPEMLARIKEEITFFGFTTQELGFVETQKQSTTADATAAIVAAPAPQAAAPISAPAQAPAAPAFQAPKYVAASIQKPTRNTLRIPKKKPRRKPSGFKTYRDERGNVWSGQGHQPQWFKDALTLGKKREEMLTGA